MKRKCNEILKNDNEGNDRDSNEENILMIMWR